MPGPASPSRLSRRALLRLGIGATLGAATLPLAAACQQAAPPPAAPAKPAEPAKPAAPAQPTEAPKPAAAAKPTDAPKPAAAAQPTAAAPAAAKTSGQNVLTVAVPTEAPSLDPVDSAGIQPNVSHHLFRKLYRMTPDMTPEPDLVVSEKIADDQVTWTLEIQKDVTFFDGTPLNAETVKYTIDRMLQPERKAPMAVLFTPIKEVRVKDDHTVELVTKEPFASLKNNLAHPNAGILSPKADQELKERFGRAPVSAGPYMVKEWAAGDRIVLARFPGYKGPAPHWDEIVYRVVPAAETRLAMLETGQANVAEKMPATQAPAVQGNSNLQVIPFEGTRLQYFWFNLDMPPTNDIKVRQALNLAIDRETIMKKIMLGAASPVTSVMEKIISFSTPVGTLEYKPDEARAMLQAAGVTGQKLKMVGTQNSYPFDRQVAEAVVGFFKEVGVEAELEIVADSAAHLEVMSKRAHHMGIVGWGGSTGDPDQYFRRQLWGEVAGKPWNFSGYKNPEVDALIAQGARTFDNPGRAKIYADVQRIAWNDWPWLLLHRTTSFAFGRANLTDFDVYVNGESLVYTRARPK